MSETPTTKLKQRLFLAALIRRVDSRTITWAELSTDLKTLYRQLRNRPPVKKARPRAHPVTPAVAQAVWEFYRANPHAINREIGRRFNIDAGRVSEILAGKRL